MSVREKLLSKLIALLPLNHPFYGKDFDSNLKWIVTNLHRIQDKEKFLQDAIDVHKKGYVLGG